jgi:hypothetical protein
MGRTATSGIDYTSRDYEGFRQAIIEELEVEMPEYTDTSETDAGIVIIENVSKQLDVLSYYMDAIANETLLPTLQRRDNASKWCSILSYTPRNSTPSRVYQVFTLSGVQDTDTIIPAGTYVKTAQTTTEPEIVFETEADLTIPAGKLGNETDTNGKYLYKVSAVQGISVNREIVGSSIGVANQSFVLNYFPVIADSLTVLVNEGTGFEPWTKVTNFVDSGISDRHFTMSLDNEDRATITFGDGVFGKIPTAYTNGIYAEYRVGGGAQGNVGANTITVMDSNIALVASTFNPETVYERGVDKETVSEIKVNAPRASETLWGALTLKDFSNVILLNFPDVVFATSAVNTSDTDSIDIYLLTKDGASISTALLSSLTAFFDENSGGRKIVGANVIAFHPASLVSKDLSANLIVKDRYSRATIESQVRALITDYFAVGNYDFNKELSLSELTSLVMSDETIAGIKSFYFTSPTDAVVTPTTGQIFTLGTLTFTSSGGVA